MMAELMNTYVDAAFLDALNEIVSGVGIGVVIAAIVVMVAWVLGLVIKLGLES